MSEIGPYFLDANIIMYALGQEHPLKEPCRTLIDQIGDGRFAVVFQSLPGKIIPSDKHFISIPSRATPLDAIKGIVRVDPVKLSRSHASTTSRTTTG